MRDKRTTATSSPWKPTARSAFTWGSVGLLIGGPGYFIWSLTGEAPDAESLAIPILAVALAGLVFLATLDSAARARRAETSERISQRSQKADEELEEALAAHLRRLDDESRQENDALVLARLWASVNGRLEKYHDDAQAQGRQVFAAAMTAMWLGFLLLIISGVAAITTTSTTGAIVAGSLGGVSAAVAGYIAKTFLRAHQETSRHLRGYFLHPVEMSRYLSAERAIAQSGLASDAQAELMRVLVHSMVTGSLVEGAGPSESRP